MAFNLFKHGIRTARNWCLQSGRSFSLTPYRLEKLSGNTHKVNNLEKKFLVWTGKFKTVEEIPTYLPPDVVDRARNRMRIRIANIMMGLTLVACLFMAISGKRAQERGESITLQTIERHKQLREEGEREKKEGTAQ